MGDYVVDPTTSSTTSMEPTTSGSCMGGLETHETTGPEISSTTVQDSANIYSDDMADSIIIFKAGMLKIHLGSRNLPRPSFDSVVDGYLALPVDLEDDEDSYKIVKQLLVEKLESICNTTLDGEAYKIAKEGLEEECKNIFRHALLKIAESNCERLWLTLSFDALPATSGNSAKNSALQEDSANLAHDDDEEVEEEEEEDEDEDEDDDDEDEEEEEEEEEESGSSASTISAPCQPQVWHLKENETEFSKVGEEEMYVGDKWSDSSEKNNLMKDDEEEDGGVELFETNEHTLYSSTISLSGRQYTKTLQESRVYLEPEKLHYHTQMEEFLKKEPVIVEHEFNKRRVERGFSCDLRALPRTGNVAREKEKQESGRVTEAEHQHVKQNNASYCIQSEEDFPRLGGIPRATRALGKQMQTNRRITEAEARHKKDDASCCIQSSMMNNNLPKENLKGFPRIIADAWGKQRYHPPVENSWGKEFGPMYEHNDESKHHIQPSREFVEPENSIKVRVLSDASHNHTILRKEGNHRNSGVSDEDNLSFLPFTPTSYSHWTISHPTLDDPTKVLSSSSSNSSSSPLSSCSQNCLFSTDTSRWTTSPPPDLCKVSQGSGNKPFIAYKPTIDKRSKYLGSKGGVEIVNSKRRDGAFSRNHLVDDANRKKYSSDKNRLAARDGAAFPGTRTDTVKSNETDVRIQDGEDTWKIVENKIKKKKKRRNIKNKMEEDEKEEENEYNDSKVNSPLVVGHVNGEGLITTSRVSNTFHALEGGDSNDYGFEHNDGVESTFHALEGGQSVDKVVVKKRYQNKRKKKPKKVGIADDDEPLRRTTTVPLRNKVAQIGSVFMLWVGLIFVLHFLMSSNSSVASDFC